MRTLCCLDVSGALLIVAMAGCKPDYPACDTDKDCKSKEFCVGRKCQKCRDARDCGEGRECMNGICNAIPAIAEMLRSARRVRSAQPTRCQACTADSQCPAGKLCMTGRCSVPQCTRDEKLRSGSRVRARLVCWLAEGGGQEAACDLETVYFDFDKSKPDSSATSALAQNATCMKRTDMPVSLVGRADSRGTTSTTWRSPTGAPSP